MPSVSLSRSVLLAAIVSSIFFVELGAARLWDRDEPRNARASHEMLERGDWIVPTFNGALRDHKPILLYWGQMASYMIVGESEFSARLPSALCAILAVLAVAVLASRLSGRTRGISRDGFWAAGALATCLLFVMAGRAATPDACLIAFSTLGIAALVIAAIVPAPPYSTGSVGKARWIPAAFGYTMLGLAALAKGPVGIILPLFVVHVWWLVCHRMQTREQSPPVAGIQPAGTGAIGERLQQITMESWLTFNPRQCVRAVWDLRTIPGVLVCFLAAAPWYIVVGMETDGAFLRGFFLDHNVGRAMNSMEGHNGTLLFYPVTLLVGTFPWSLWLIPILLWCRNAIRGSVVGRQMVVLAGVWVSVYLVAFSIASTKLPSYLTPCYAGAALVIGGYLRQFESTWSLPSLNWRRTAYLLTITVGLCIAGGVLWLSDSQEMPLLRRAAFGGVAISAMGCAAFLLEKSGRVRMVPATWLAGATVFQIVLFGYGAKSIDRYRDDLRLFAIVKAQAPTEHWISIGGMEPSWVHYLNREIVEVTGSVSQDASWTVVEQYLQSHPGANVIVVGDKAIARVEEKNTFGDSTSALKRIASADRFLRPGRIAVYSRIAANSAASETGGRFSSRPTAGSKKIRAQPVGFRRQPSELTSPPTNPLRQP